MRKKFLAIAIIVFFAACQPTLTKPTVSSQLENAKVTAFLNMHDPISQRQAFVLRSAEEKATVWQRHIEMYIANHSLTDKQSALVAELKKIAVKENYASAASAAIAEVRNAKPWMEKAIQNFSGQEIIELGLELQQISKNNQTNKKQPEQYCICRVGSLFTCWHGTTIGGGPIYEQCSLIAPCHLVRAGEEEHGGGCGFIMLSTCKWDTCGGANS